MTAPAVLVELRCLPPLPADMGRELQTRRRGALERVEQYRREWRGFVRRSLLDLKPRRTFDPVRALGGKSRALAFYAAVCQLFRLPMKARDIVKYLLDRLADRWARAVVRRSTMAGELGLTVPQLDYYLAEIREAGLIDWDAEARLRPGEEHISQGGKCSEYRWLWTGFLEWLFFGCVQTEMLTEMLTEIEPSEPSKPQTLNELDTAKGAGIYRSSSNTATEPEQSVKVRSVVDAPRPASPTPEVVPDVELTEPSFERPEARVLRHYRESFGTEISDTAYAQILQNLRKQGISFAQWAQWLEQQGQYREWHANARRIHRPNGLLVWLSQGISGFVKQTFGRALMKAAGTGMPQLKLKRRSGGCERCNFTGCRLNSESHTIEWCECSGKS